LHNGLDYRLCIIIPAVINGFWAFVNFFYVPNTPEEYGCVAFLRSAPLPSS
jgi:hypothetical protein